MTNVYMIYDIVAELIFGGLMVAPNHAVAMRHFTDLANNQGNIVNQHLADFKLVCIGAINESNGELVALHPTITLLKGTDMLKAPEARTEKPTLDMLKAPQARR